MKKSITIPAALVLAMAFVFVSCSKIEEAFNAKKEQVQELTDKTAGEAKDIIQKGKDEVKKEAENLKK